MMESHRPASRWPALLKGAAVAGMLVALAVGGWDAHLRNARLARDLARAEADLERVRASKARLNDELKALDEDPLYVDSVLQWMKAAARTEPAPPR